MREDRAIHASRLLAVALAAFAVGIPAAAAAGDTACWKRVIDDVYDGRADGAYPCECVREALDQLPESGGYSRDTLHGLLLELASDSCPAEAPAPQLVADASPSSRDGGADGRAFAGAVGLAVAAAAGLAAVRLRRGRRGDRATR